MSIIERMIEEFEKNWSRWNIEGRCSNSVYLRNCADLYNASKYLMRNDCITRGDFTYIQNRMHDGLIDMNIH